MHQVWERRGMVEKEIDRRPINGFDGYYEVDSNGNIYSLDRVITVTDGNRVYQKPIKGRVLKPHKTKNGYLTIILSGFGVPKRYYIHRIVAETFLPNPHNYACVNHKDENRENNSVGNLEWCSYSYNATYNGSSKKRGEKIKGRISPKRNKITAYGITKSRMEWAKESGLSPHTIRKRLKSGWSAEEAVSRPLCRSRYERINDGVWGERPR